MRLFYSDDLPDIQCLFVGVRLGGVIVQKGAHGAHTMPPRPHRTSFFSQIHTCAILHTMAPEYSGSLFPKASHCHSGILLLPRNEYLSRRPLQNISTSLTQVDAASQAFISVTLSAITGTAAMALLPASIWKPMLFMFLSNAMGFSTAGFVDNFYLDSATPEESARTGYPVCEDCPHFSATFYYTVIGVLDQIMMVVGSWVFRTYMRDWTYRTALSVSGLLMFGTRCARAASPLHGCTLSLFNVSYGPIRIGQLVWADFKR